MGRGRGKGKGNLLTRPFKNSRSKNQTVVAPVQRPAEPRVDRSFRLAPPSEEQKLTHINKAIDSVIEQNKRYDDILENDPNNTMHDTVQKIAERNTNEDERLRRYRANLFSALVAQDLRLGKYTRVSATRSDQLAAIQEYLDTLEKKFNTEGLSEDEQEVAKGIIQNVWNENSSFGDWDVIIRDYSKIAKEWEANHQELHIVIEAEDLNPRAFENYVDRSYFERELKPSDAQALKDLFNYSDSDSFSLDPFKIREEGYKRFLRTKFDTRLAAERERVKAKRTFKEKMTTKQASKEEIFEGLKRFTYLHPTPSEKSLAEIVKEWDQQKAYQEFLDDESQDPLIQEEIKKKKVPLSHLKITEAAKTLDLDPELLIDVIRAEITDSYQADMDRLAQAKKEAAEIENKYPSKNQSWS